MEIEATVDIAASAAQIWMVLIDVERWSEWTASITSIQRQDTAAFGLGSQALIHQPRLPAAVWRVTQFESGRGFVWENKALGALTVGAHWITPKQDDQCTVVLKIRQTGFLVPLLRPLIPGLTRRYLDMEAQGLKQRCEGITTHPAR